MFRHLQDRVANISIKFRLQNVLRFLRLIDSIKFSYLIVLDRYYVTVRQSHDNSTSGIIYWVLLFYRIGTCVPIAQNVLGIWVVSDAPFWWCPRRRKE